MKDSKETLWPGWETVGILGRGSFGTVYHIQRNIFGDVESAALKTISIPRNRSDIDELYGDGYSTENITKLFEGHMQSIVSEYSLMRKLSGSAYIVNCDDVRYERHADGIGWDIFIKMELLTPLTNVLPERVPEDTVIQLGLDMCKALEMCGRYNILHRDIKPQNIFVSTAGDYKLGDFGIAKTMVSNAGGTRIGTPRYMAPEVFNVQPYDSRADLYSLGLVLYWMLNEKRMPFQPLPPVELQPGMDQSAGFRRLSGESFPPPAHGSDALKRIVMKACAYYPENRYASAKEMLDALNALQLGRSAVTDRRGQTTVLNDAWKQSPRKELDVHQTKRFAFGDNPGGKAISVQVGSETRQVWIPEEFQNGQTFYYEGMGLKSPCSEERGDLYLTVYAVLAPPQRPESGANKHKKGRNLAVALIFVLLLGAACFGLSLWEQSDIKIPKPNITGSTEPTVTNPTEPTIQKQNYLMRDDTVSVERAREKLGSEASFDQLVYYCAAQPVLGSNIPRSQIVSVTFLDTIAAAPENSWDVSDEQDQSVLAWTVPNGDFFDLYIAAEGEISGTRAAPQMFFMYTNLREVNFNGNLNMENATDMTGMFYYCVSLKKVDMGSLNTSAVQNMSELFYECRSLESLDLSALNTSSVTDMGHMFQGCSKLKALDVTGFDTSSVQNMSCMFEQCILLETLDVSGFDTSSVVNISRMFEGCTNLRNLSVSHFDLSNATETEGFYRSDGILRYAGH